MVDELGIGDAFPSTVLTLVEKSASIPMSGASMGARNPETGVAVGGQLSAFRSRP